MVTLDEYGFQTEIVPVDPTPFEVMMGGRLLRELVASMTPEEKMALQIARNAEVLERNAELLKEAHRGR